MELILDWISITSHTHHGKMQDGCHYALNDWNQWELTTARNGYTEGAKHSTGTKVYQNHGRKEMGTHIIYSGKALQKIEQEFNTSAFDVLKWHVKRGHNIARIDIAVDFKNTSLTVQDFENAYDSGLCKTKLRSANVIKEKHGDGHTLYIGSKKKRKKLVRIYDKMAETKTAIAWTRCEIQIMGKPATKIAVDATNGSSMKQVLLGAMLDVVDFPSVPLWSSSFNDIDKVKLGSESDHLADTREWLNRTVFKSILKEADKDGMWFDEYISALLVEARKSGIRR